MPINKKLIGFDDELLKEIEYYSNERKYSFTQAVRTLIQLGLTTLGKPEQDKQELQPYLKDDSIDLITRVKQLEKDISWWTSDDVQSKLGNLEHQVGEMDKRINVLTKVSQLFKSHLKDREIHFKD